MPRAGQGEVGAELCLHRKGGIVLHWVLACCGGVVWLAWAAEGPVAEQALLGKGAGGVFAPEAQTSACTSSSAVP